MSTPDSSDPMRLVGDVLTPDEQERLRVIALRLARLTSERFRTLFPDSGPLSRAHYPRHMAFFRAGAAAKERLFMAANRVGKTTAGAYELTCHLTGQYPPWWEGRRFASPVEAWACGTTSETLRDIVQTALVGPWQSETHEGGMIPSELVVDVSRRPHGLPGSLETIWVRHVTGGNSQLGLKMYEQGRRSFEGTAKHVIWCDEEPPEDCYTEMLYRTLTTQGITMVTFTPLQGMSAVVRGFLQPDSETAARHKVVIQAGWADVPHLEESEKAALLSTTPPYQREARTQGTPSLGAGAIYPMAESELAVDPFPLPRHYRRAFGLDAGGGAKPTAIVWGAEDPETGICYVYDVYRRESPEIALHIEAIRQRGLWIPGAGDADALILTDTDAEQLIRIYQRAGVDLVRPQKAVESGIQTVWERMTAGRLKVFRSCGAWFEEFRVYHRDEKGRVVKQHDHVMDATRYLVVSGLARAKTPTHDQDRTAQEADLFRGRAGMVGRHERSWMAD